MREAVICESTVGKGRAVSHLEHSRSDKVFEFLYFQAVHLLDLETKVPCAPLLSPEYKLQVRAVASKPIQRRVSEYYPWFITTRLFTRM